MKEGRFSDSQSLGMAQSRPLSLTSKLLKLEKDVRETETHIIALRKLICQSKRKHFGNKNDLSKHHMSLKNIDSLCQSSHQVDNLLLKIQNLINQCISCSIFLQQQLLLQKIERKAD